MFTMSSSDSTTPTTSQSERCSQKAKTPSSAISASAGTACSRSMKPSMRKPRTVEMKLKNQAARSEEHTSELQSLMRLSYAVFCLKTKTSITQKTEYCKP